MNANPEIKNALSQNLIKLRNLKSATQEEVADSLEISNKTLSKWENGASSPDADMIVTLADYYGVSIDALYGRESSPINGNIKAYVYDYLKSLPSDERMNKAFELTYEFIKGTMNISVDNSNQKYPPNFLNASENSVNLSAISNDAGTELLVNGDILNMFVMLATNKDKFKTVISTSDKYRPLFEYLGKPYAIEVFTVIYRSHFPSKFTFDFAAKKLNISSDTVKNLLDDAVDLNLLKKRTASLKNGDVEVYCRPADDDMSERTVLPMICLAFQQMCVKDTWYIHAHHGEAKMMEEL